MSEQPRGTKLSVNVNKIATLRNARGGNLPNVLQVSNDLLTFGAHGITVHPRPDGRHIRPQDVLDISEMLLDWNSENNSSCEFNVEGFPSPEYMTLIQKARPHQATLVPDPPDVITSNSGWKMQENLKLLTEVTKELKAQSIKVSLFVDVFQWDADELAALEEIAADRIELYTEAYARSFGSPEQNKILDVYHKVAEAVQKSGYEVNAGHDLNSQNLPAFAQRMPFLNEVSIGHAFISEALYWGMEKTTQVYLEALGYEDSPT